MVVGDDFAGEVEDGGAGLEGFVLVALLIVVVIVVVVVVDEGGSERGGGGELELGGVHGGVGVD